MSVPEHPYCEGKMYDEGIGQHLNHFQVESLVVSLGNSTVSYEEVSIVEISEPNGKECSD